MTPIISLKATCRAVLFYIALAGVLLFIGLPYCILHRIKGRSNRDLTKICCRVCPKLFDFFKIKISVEGKENLPEQDGFVLVANHQSYLDICALFSGVTHMAFLIKAELWKIPIFGKILSWTGSLPIFRLDPKKNVGLGNKMVEKLNKGYNFCAFPEGKRAGDGVMFRFQNGVFRIVKMHPVPILPITIIGSSTLLPKNKLKLFSGEIRIKIHPIIQPADYETLSMQELRDSTHDLIESALPYANHLRNT